MASLKDEIITLLVKAEGGCVSGAEIAQMTGCTRSAVWKAVCALKESGYEIDATTNRGYSLGGNGALTSSLVSEKLVGEAERKCSIEVLDTVGSTNAYMREKAQSGAPEGCVVISREQTNGRGRLGRQFYSPGLTGLYMSVLLRPKIDSADAALITTAAAAATAIAVEEVSGRKAQIKWVNDVLVDGKKVSGILTEGGVSLETGGFDWVVLGIGVNVYEQTFPDDIKDIAGSVFGSDAGKDAVSLIAAKILNGFFAFYEDLGARTFFGDYDSRLNVKNRQVSVIRGNDVRDALALGIDKDFRLMVRYPDGAEEKIQCGEISLRVKDNADEK